MHARRRLSSFRRPAVLFSALALAATTVACGTSNTAEPSSSTPESSSAPSPMSATGPTVTVPGLGSAEPETSESAPASSPAPTTTTVVVPPSSKKTTTSSESESAPASTDEETSSEAEPTTEAPAEPPASTTEPADDGQPTTEEPPTSEQDDPSTTPEDPTTPEQPATTEEEPAGGNGGGMGNGGAMTRKVVVIDPGHNGQNGAHPEIIGQQVDAGFGEMKDCNTTGTETNDGYTEALFNWQVSMYLKDALEARGITVVMTRDSNDGVGPCVNERAAIGNDNNADAVVSVHGDGDMNGGANGFYVMTSERDPAGPEMADKSSRLANNIRDALVAGGLSTSNSIGSEGLFKRDDLSGLNLSLRPTVMLELGNMRGDVDAGLMTSEQGQQKYAQAIALGTIQFLIGR